MEAREPRSFPVVQEVAPVAAREVVGDEDLNQSPEARMSTTAAAAAIPGPVSMLMTWLRPLI